MGVSYNGGFKNIGGVSTGTPPGEDPVFLQGIEGLGFTRNVNNTSYNGIKRMALSADGQYLAVAIQNDYGIHRFGDTGTDERRHGGVMQLYRLNAQGVPVELIESYTAWRLVNDTDNRSPLYHPEFIENYYYSAPQKKLVFHSATQPPHGYSGSSKPGIITVDYENGAWNEFESAANLNGRYAHTIADGESVPRFLYDPGTGIKVQILHTPEHGGGLKTLTVSGPVSVGIGTNGTTRWLGTDLITPVVTDEQTTFTILRYNGTDAYTVAAQGISLGDIGPYPEMIIVGNRLIIINRMGTTGNLVYDYNYNPATLGFTTRSPDPVAAFNPAKPALFASYNDVAKRLVVGTDTATYIWSDNGTGLRLNSASNTAPIKSITQTQNTHDIVVHNSGNVIALTQYDLHTIQVPNTGYRVVNNKQPANSILFSWDFTNPADTTFAPNIETTYYGNSTAAKVGDISYGTLGGQTALTWTTLANTAAPCAVTYPMKRDFRFMYYDFTADFWLYVSQTPTNQSVSLLTWKGNRGVAAPLAIWLNNQTIRFNGSGVAESTTVGNLFNITAGVWHHISMVRSGNTLTMYRNGTAGSSLTINMNRADAYQISYPAVFDDADFVIGHETASASMQGGIRKLRLRNFADTNSMASNPL